MTYKVTANRKPVLQNASLLDKNDTPTQGYFCVLFSTSSFFLNKIAPECPCSLRQRQCQSHFLYVLCNTSSPLWSACAFPLSHSSERMGGMPPCQPSTLIMTHWAKCLLTVPPKESPFKEACVNGSFLKHLKCGNNTHKLRREGWSREKYSPWVENKLAGCLCCVELDFFLKLRERKHK